MQKRCTKVKMLSRRIACLFGREETSNYSLDACNINSIISTINSINGGNKVVPEALNISNSC